MRVLLAQLEPLGDLDSNVVAIERAVGLHPDADLAVFPELFLSGYDLDDVDGRALEVGSAPVHHLCALARRESMALLIGFAERAESGVASGAVCIDRDGTLKTSVRKAHLFGDERRVLVAGGRLQVVELAGVTLGVMVCFDVEFPEVARALAMNGAQALVTVAANMRPYAREHEILPLARAIENGLPHVYVNRVGREGGFDFVGGSFAADARGRVLAQLGDGLELRTVEVPTIADGLVPYLAERRPELYSEPASKLVESGGMA